MSLLVVGSVALDSVKTPFGEATEVLGGSATYFSIAASYFTEVRLVAVIGDDFPQQHIDLLKERGVHLGGLQKREGETFRWRGEYSHSLNEAKTLETRLNVFETFHPDLPPVYQDSDFVFLANIDPELQCNVLTQIKHPKCVCCDTMNFWISGKRKALQATLEQVDMAIINDGEARMLASDTNLVKAAQKILKWGPKRVIIKRGEYGVMMTDGATTFAAPAYPVENVFDPTGAGDSFAGGFMGYLAKTGQTDDATLRRAVIYGSVMASFNVEAFSVNGLRHLTQDAIHARYRQFQALMRF